LFLTEACRRKRLLALLVLTALVIGATVWGFSRLPGIVLSEGPGLPRHPISSAEVRLATSQLLILVMFTYSFVLALSAALTAAPAISSELESGVALAILTRPISRLQVLLGKWVGLAVLIVVYVGFASLSEFLLVDFVTGYFPPDPLGFIAYLAAETLVLMPIALLLR